MSKNQIPYSPWLKNLNKLPNKALLTKSTIEKLKEQMMTFLPLKKRKSQRVAHPVAMRNMALAVKAVTVKTKEPEGSRRWLQG
jgi:hypothetical protein